MADVTPTAPSKGIGGSQTSGANSDKDNVQTAPAKVISFPSDLNFNGGNIILGARLSSANADGSLTLRTAAGDLTIRTNANIQAGVPLQVQLSPGNPPSAVLILTKSNDMPGTLAATGASLMPDIATTVKNSDTTIIQPTLVQPDLPDLSLGTTTRALVLSAAIDVPTLPAAAVTGAVNTTAPQLVDQLEAMLSTQNSGQVLDADQLQVLSQSIAGKLPTQVGPLNISAKLLETVQQTLKMLDQQSSASVSDGHAMAMLMQLMGKDKLSAPPGASSPIAIQLLDALAEGSQLQLRLVKIIPSTNAQAITPETLKQLAMGGPVITGEISTQQINGQPVVQTAQGNLLLPNAGNLPPGTKLIFQVIPQDGLPIETAAVTSSVTLLTNPGTARIWPQLAAALQELASQNAELMPALLASMPRLNAQLPMTTLFFLQALRTGEVRNWLGTKALDVLRRSGAAGANLLTALEDDFKTLSRNMTKLQNGDWKNYPIPLLSEQGVQMMQMNVRDHFQPINPDDDTQNDNPDNFVRSTRFLVDMEFSELGPLQIDGLIRPRDVHQKQLDIILRTQKLLPQEFRRDLRAMYDNSLEVHGLKGALSFQAGFQNWVKLAHSAVHQNAIA